MTIDVYHGRSTTTQHNSRIGSGNDTHGLGDCDKFSWCFPLIRNKKNNAGICDMDLVKEMNARESAFIIKVSASLFQSCLL